jgi:Family of unknown function (DUF6193)
VTQEPRSQYARLYPEISRAGSLQAAMQAALTLAGHELTAVLTSAPGWRDCATRVGDGHRHVTALAASQERWFQMEFWDRGVMMASGKTADLPAVADAIGLWQAGSGLRELHSACPFVRYSPLAEAHERGDAVHVQWMLYRRSPASHVEHDLIEAAYAQPPLRALFPFHSHRTLHFSRCTGFPYTRDAPAITPQPDGKYLVTWWRPPHGTAILGEADNPSDAVALVLAGLPADCGPAVAGTADDLRAPGSA